MLEVFALGVAPLCRLLGVWERQIDDNWEIVLNRHLGGTIAAGTVANENALISALKKALK